MARIHLLTEEVINLIAAGEVVERPASVVKELVENSLDSGASRIEVEVEGGGRKSVTVRDDGCGMSRHDLLLSVQRHATSKLREPGDLDGIATLGFRGEALPSIAAVSHMSIVSSDGEGEAWKLEIDGGVLHDLSPAARTRGTTVSVEGLFFNTPARRRFLRSDETELGWVTRHMTALAFARPDVSFVLTSGGQRVFGLPPGDLESRVRERFSIPGSEKAISAEVSDGGTSVSLTAFPDRRTAGRLHGYVIVSGRPVYARIVSSAVESVLSGPAGHPLWICTIAPPAADFDANVHPAKLEIRFRHPSRIEALVSKAAAGAAGARMSEIGGSISGQYAAAERREGMPLSEWGRLSSPPDIRALDALFHLNAPLPQPQSGLADAMPVVQVGRRYLVSAVAGGMVIVDQHAAHERILYELALGRLGSQAELPSQRLLLPESVELDPDSAAILSEQACHMRAAGFEYSIEDGRAVVYAVPEGVGSGLEAFMEAVMVLGDPASMALSGAEKAAAAAACAGAVKFGEVIDQAAARQMLDMLFSTSEPFRCPHGRPTLIEIPFDELARRFGR